MTRAIDEVLDFIKSRPYLSESDKTIILMRLEPSPSRKERELALERMNLIPQTTLEEVWFSEDPHS